MLVWCMLVWCIVQLCMLSVLLVHMHYHLANSNYCHGAPLWLASLLWLQLIEGKYSLHA